VSKDFTPTTDQVREGYASDPEAEYRDPIGYPAYEQGLRRAFDRWLTAHDLEVTAQPNREADDLREWITKFSQEMPEESYFSHNIDGSEEEEILQFIQLMTGWYMTVMQASEAVDYETDLTYNMRFMLNPEMQTFERVSDEGNIWHTCAACLGPIRFNAAPTGSWWSHAEHPHDGHDAELHG
jgi:hypothetical protein